MRTIRRLAAGGSTGNEQLTAALGTVLIVLLAVEGATLLQLTALLTVHAFVGMLLIPVVALKLASVAWRMVQYYRGAEEYVRKGPPQLALRVLVAPVLVASTVVLFGTGVALLVLDRTQGLVELLHKASFIVWLGAAGIHVLVHVLRLPVLMRLTAPGSVRRTVLVVAAVAAGALLATATLPAADRLQDSASSQFGFDDG